jgi:subfamily B ATP-binding cassette protein MsbA
MDLYIRLISYVKPYILRIVIAMICTVLAAGTNLYIPKIIGEIIDNVLATKDLSALNNIAIGIIVLMILQGIFLYGQTYFMAYVGQKVIIDIRRAIYQHLQQLSLLFFETRQIGTIMSYITNDVAALQSALVDNVIELVTQSVVLIGSIIFMFYLDWKLAFITFASLPFIIQAINISGRKLRIKSRVLQERAAHITAFLQESLSAVRVVKSFVREDYELNRFDHENNQNFNAQMKTVQIASIITPVINILTAIGVTGIVWFGGHEVIDGNLTSGALISFLTYAINLTTPIKRLSSVYGNIQKALAAAQRVFEIIDMEPDIKNSPTAITLPPVNGHVVFHDVTFEYKIGEPVLSNLSFEAKPGQMVALVGPSGSGKTTIANLIPRFYDPVSGYIEIDGVKIKEVTLNSLREQIGIVPQETLLFNGTVYENIIYGDLHASQSAIIDAAKAANAHNFIIEMPNGYETLIGERGSTLSGGQRQRIAIARAILKNPQILILDEATSALDTESESLVQEALNKLMVGRTSFVIAHRLSTVQKADLILVMEKGKIIEYGQHEDLVIADGLYSKLYHIHPLNEQLRH